MQSYHHSATLGVIVIMYAFFFPSAEGCSRDLSRQARAIVRQKVAGVGLDVDMPLACAFHPSRDKYLDQEQHKSVVRRHQYKCDYCGKIFRTEDYLDDHMERRHDDKVTEDATVCLGDFCDILNCTGYNKLHPEPCQKTAMAKRRFHCGAIFHKCFPPEHSKEMNDLHGLFLDKICAPLTCQQNQQKLGATIPVGGLLGGARSAVPWQTWKTVGVCMLLGGLVAFYVFFFISGSALSRRGDLRRLRTTSHAGTAGTGNTWTVILPCLAKKRKQW